MTDTCPRCGGILIEGEALCARCAGGKGEGKPRVQQDAAGRSEAPGKGATKRDKLKDFSLVGKAIGGKYKVLEVLGQGGFGTVYLVEITAGMVGEKLALKILPEELSTQETFRNQFLDEIRIAMRLVDKNIVQVRDVGVTEDGILYYTMDFCPGTTLAQVLHDDGAIPISRTLLIVLNVLRGLQTAHAAGIVHRDLKPANIMVEMRGGKDIVRVLDFGIATAIKVDDDKPRPFGGSPHYMPPEQFMGEPVNFYTDLYSIGVILYECLTGERPYPGDTPQAVFRSLKSRVPPPPETLNPEISKFPGLSALVMKCIERNPERRFQSARELFDAVHAVLLRGTSIDQPPAPPLATKAPSPPGPVASSPRPAPPRLRRRRVRRARGPAHAGAVALATLILAAVVVGVIFNAEIARWWRTRDGSVPNAPAAEPRENPPEKARGTEGEKETNARPAPPPGARGGLRQDDEKVAAKPLSSRKAEAKAQLSERTRSLVSEGNEALRSGEWKAALEKADTALALDRESVEAHRLRGMASLRLGDYFAAADSLEQAIPPGAAPDPPLAIAFAEALAKVSPHLLDDAAAVLTDVLKDPPRDPEILLSLAKLLESMKREDDLAKVLLLVESGEVRSPGLEDFQKRSTAAGKKASSEEAADLERAAREAYARDDPANAVLLASKSCSIVPTLEAADTAANGYLNLDEAEKGAVFLEDILPRIEGSPSGNARQNLEAKLACLRARARLRSPEAPEGADLKGVEAALLVAVKTLGTSEGKGEKRCVALARLGLARVAALRGDLTGVDRALEPLARETDPSILLEEGKVYFDLARGTKEKTARIAAHEAALRRLRSLLEAKKLGDSFRRELSYLLGSIHLDLGDLRGTESSYQTALVHFAAAHEAGLKTAPLYEGWATAYHRAGNLIRAAQLYRSLYDVAPSPENCLRAARAYVAANPRSPEAREILEEGRKRFSTQRGFEEASKTLLDDLTRR